MLFPTVDIIIRVTRARETKWVFLVAVALDTVRLALVGLNSFNNKTCMTKKFDPSIANLQLLLLIAAIDMN